jgi:mannonate dehydratase
MSDREFEGRLFGDLSAITQTRRAKIALERILRTPQWHPRLLNGSDYPLPGLMPIFSVDYLASTGMIEAAAAPVLGEIRRHNVLLFDFLAKRLLRVDGKRLPAQVFETREFFRA